MKRISEGSRLLVPVSGDGKINSWKRGPYLSTGEKLVGHAPVSEASQLPLLGLLGHQTSFCMVTLSIRFMVPRLQELKI